MKRFALILAATAFVHAQTPPEPKSGSAEQEQLDLSKAIGEAGSSGVDYVRALERHLAKYPESKRRAEIEKALAKSAVDANDHTRILLYGEKVLKAEPQSDDLQLLDKVTRALLDSDDAESAARALGYAKRFGIQIEAMRPKASESHMSEGAWNDQLDQSKARVLVLEARATGNMSDSEGALKLARSSWDTSPNAESARETGKWLVKLNRNAEAVEYYADAFAMDDSRTTEADRARDRARLGDMYASLNGSEKGLGDAILLAYDRVSALKRTRLAALKLKDPNAGATELLDFTLPDAAGGAPVTLSSLKGKTVVIDFWATWCGPCKVQHPMIEEIQKRYEDSGGVVFLSVDSDSDRSLVTPFLKEMHWTGRIYFDAGVARLLNVSSIPTVIVLDKTGKISSRMIGFIPERFEDMLTQRIEETRAN
ncbi:MAG TPA: redoxin family protein [Bryobacteraceae bacterium]|nr:redoxin family protein [Bryobacteraceae bacterium]